MKKQLTKLCLASILSLSINADLNAHELAPTISVMPETTVTEDISSKVEGFIQEVLKIYPTLEVKFSAQDGELAFSGSSQTSVQNIDLIFESLYNQEWIDSLKSFKMYNVYFDPNSSLFTSILTKMPNLQSLILNNTKLGSMADDEFNAFANILSKLTNLQTLSLRENLRSMGDERINTIANTLSILTKLQKLDLSHNNLGGKSVLLASPIANMTDLQELLFGNNCLGMLEGAGLNTLVNTLSKLTKLQTLSLDHNNLQNGVATLASAIANMTDLQSLYLADNKLGIMTKDDFNTFVNILPKLTNLRDLNLSSNNLGGRLAILAPTIANMNNLQLLYLNNNHLELMTKDEFNTFVNVLSKLTNLRDLNLNSNDLGRRLAILAPAIANMTNLQFLYLAYNKLWSMGKDELNTFANALSKLTKLQTLSLDHNNLQNGVATLASAIANMTDLQSLGLSYNKLGLMTKDRFNTFANNLSKLTNLQKLYLGWNNLGDTKGDGINTLASALSTLTKLQKLDLPHNDLGEKSALLVSAIANITNLQNLSLIYNNLGSMNKDSFNTFANNLSKLTNLLFLNLSENNLGGINLNEINTFANALSKLTKLQVLDLSLNFFGKNFASLSPAFAKMTNLQILSLRCNNLGSMDDGEFNTFANNLSKLNNLLFLGLSWNNLGSMGEEKINTFTSALTALTKLQQLNLSNNKLGGKSALLVSAIANMTNLQNLNLQDNLRGASDIDIKKFANALSRLTKLQQLDLTENYFGENLALLAPAFAKMTNLQTLILRQANLGQMQPDSWQIFTTSLSFTPNLQILDLGCNAINDLALNAFIEALFQTESIAGIPNLISYSDHHLEAEHTLEIKFSNSLPLDSEREKLREALSAFNPAIKVTFK